MSFEQIASCSNTLRNSLQSCWTCKVRRKKCDGNAPVCDGCLALQITCYHSRSKPEWMDGGMRQEEMAEWLKCKVKENGHRRRGEPVLNVLSERVLAAETRTEENSMLLERQHTEKDPVSALRHETSSPMSTTRSQNMLLEKDNGQEDQNEPVPTRTIPSVRREGDCGLANQFGLASTPFSRSDTVLVMFYLESLFPFLFPFHQPSALHGGRAWILELIISSPVVRQATLCQSNYYLSVAQSGTYYDECWERMVAHTGDVFEVLRRSLEVINGFGIADHMSGAVRIMTSIMQLQRYEITVSSFRNCHAHLDAAVALFQQLLHSASITANVTCPRSCFDAVLKGLGSSSRTEQHTTRIPSAEQAAFCFSSALLVLDDIIASTVHQKAPKLYGYHRSLLDRSVHIEPVINLADAIGCENWPLMQVADIAALDAWKHECQKDGSLDIIQLVERAKPIKDVLEAGITQLELNTSACPPDTGSFLDAMTAERNQQLASPRQKTLVTKVWAHAALLYLSVVVSGWQPASADVRFNVHHVIQILSHQMSPPGLLRTLTWPFCVAGCLAESALECQIRSLVEKLQPPILFGTVRQAFQIIEQTWRNRDTNTAWGYDFAACFERQGEFVLLV